jgi:phosphatidylglycerol:prolipoprotein diacylglycerol transferase
MKPEIFGISTYFSFWGVAAVFGIWTGVRLARRAGFATAPSVAALVVLALALVVGSKLFYLAEYALFPADDPLPLGQDDLAGALRHGFRIPGGMLLLAAVLPLVCAALRLPLWPFADAVIPAAGIAVLCIRIGCFLNGCCFGALTDGPLGVSFPPGSRAYEWQLLHEHIGWTAERALPMHPLQLYFAALGVAVFACGRYWQSTARFPGEVFAKCYLLFFGATVLLELVRPALLHLNLVVTPIVALAALLVVLRTRQVTTAPARATS